MKDEDVIKKLEKIKLPQIEIPSHKKRLKMALFNWKYGKEKKAESIFLGLRKVLIPLGTVAVVFVIILIVSNLIAPQYTLAEVKKIAMKDPQVKELIEKGAEIKDIEIIKNKAYVLISPKEVSEDSPIETQIEKRKIKGALVEIGLKEKEVVKIKEITPKVISLTQQEKEKIKNIIKESEFPQIAGETLEIEKIEPLSTYQLDLIKKDDTVEVLQKEKEDKKVIIIYKIEDKTKQGKIDLIKREIEKVEILEKSEKLEGSSERTEK